MRSNCDELLIYKILTKFTKENVSEKSNIYVIDVIMEFRNDKIDIYTCVATPCLVTSPPLKLPG